MACLSWKLCELDPGTLSAFCVANSIMTIHCRLSGTKFLDHMTAQVKVMCLWKGKGVIVVFCCLSVLKELETVLGSVLTQV